MKGNINKLVFAFFICLTAVVTVATPSSADYDYGGIYGWYNFKTGDGLWDGSMTARSGDNVDVTIMWETSDKLKVRLCSAATGNCTAYRYLTRGGLYYEQTVTFTNMVAGSYYGDVVNATSSRRVNGKIRFLTFR
ncbi:hypothetical protein JOC86_000136 [Bacillus pakistanensis]|uniref:Uncharacterized protein n=1 Tax=Rossellomorea pakistanensis TaxID=992288 RepID=A0ABS2N6Z8_9BACI|nr:hypothetical protein [Bacillus pakistanensis]MBM7583599.1 hypothetical protein [Bacillus pakistanensis]